MKTKYINIWINDDMKEEKINGRMTDYKINEKIYMGMNEFLNK